MTSMTRRLPAVLAAAVLALSLGACSISLSGPGGSSGSAQASQGAEATGAAQASAPGQEASADAQGGVAGARSSPSARAGAAASGPAGSAERPGSAAAADSELWQRLKGTALRHSRSEGGDMTLQGQQCGYIEGDIATLTVAQDASGGVMAEHVEHLTVNGSGLIVMVQDVGRVTITGSDVVVAWVGRTPVVEDSGTGNATVAFDQLDEGLYWTCS
ncbi:DUF3060 domain-containing protein [Actinomyces capricornis]|uniref:DUF3060 domain-containing protein n=1 Tax=Actinomyces capricornis TaxID=2755559 RepID=A0ABM7UJL0_9ACTO|nr:DUF3060 domain-containing protein [Actinomyces capricornis]BDA64524.1 hypothetical protein MANAM107_13580 [Actinomyces capricornis]